MTSINQWLNKHICIMECHNQNKFLIIVTLNLSVGLMFNFLLENLWIIYMETSSLLSADCNELYRHAVWHKYWSSGSKLYSMPIARWGIPSDWLAFSWPLHFGQKEDVILPLNAGQQCECHRSSEMWLYMWHSKDLARAPDIGLITERMYISIWLKNSGRRKKNQRTHTFTARLKLSPISKWIHTGFYRNNFSLIQFLLFPDPSAFLVFPIVQVKFAGEYYWSYLLQTKWPAPDFFLFFFLYLRSIFGWLEKNGI